MSLSAYQDYAASDIPWISQRPAHWKEKPAFAVCREEAIKNADGEETTVLSLSYGKIVVRNVEKNFGLLPESFNTYQIVNPKDIILRLTDLQNDKRSLRVGLAKQRGIITSAYLKLVCKEELDPQYAYQLLHAYDITKVFYGMGGGLRQSMKFTEFRRLPFLVPALNEQKAIARFLDCETAKIDQLIAKQQRLIELLKEKRQAVISHAVTKGLNPDARMKDSGVEWLGKVPEHWLVTRLKRLSRLQSGIAKGRAVSENAITVPMLRVANVQDGYVKLDDVHNIQIEPEELTRYLLNAGDLLMNEGGDNDKLGRGTVWQAEISPCIHQNHVFAVRVFGCEPEWIALFTQSSSAKFYFYSVSKQSTNLASISSSNIKEASILLPPEHERGEIMAYLSQQQARFDTLLEKSASQILLLKERRSALISAAVTGKIDVRDWQPQQTIHELESEAI